MTSVVTHRAPGGWQGVTETSVVTHRALGGWRGGREGTSAEGAPTGSGPAGCRGMAPTPGLQRPTCSQNRHGRCPWLSTQPPVTATPTGYSKH